MARVRDLDRPHDNAVVGRCPLCNGAICYGDDVIVIDGIKWMLHEDCVSFCKVTPDELLERLGIDYYKVTAAEIIEEGY